MRRGINFVAGAALAVVFATPTSAQVLQEDFANVAGLKKAGWVFQNNSAPAPTTNGNWAQGDGSVFYDRTGVDNSYVSASFTSVGDPGGTISNWLLTPTIPLANGDTVQFYTRTVDALAFPDRLETRLSLSGSSANVGATAGSVGDFTDLLLTINPNLQTGTANYPTDWTLVDITLSGLPAGGATGRVGFRYFVTDAGTFGTNGNYIGLDSLTVTAAPEPGAAWVMGAGCWVLGAGLRRRKARRHSLATRDLAFPCVNRAKIR